MKTKMASVFAILMIALMAVGFAYAHWSKIVTIDGTVTTGTFHLTPSFHVELPEWNTKDPYGPIATATSKIEGNTLFVTLTNVYPCLTVTGYIDLINDGTIPAGLHNVIVTLPTGWHYGCVDGEYLIYDAVNDWVATATYTVRGNLMQIDPGVTEYIDFTLHFEELLKMTQTYTFSIVFEFWNWNEVQ